MSSSAYPRHSLIVARVNCSNAAPSCSSRANVVLAHPQQRQLQQQQLLCGAYLIRLVKPLPVYVGTDYPTKEACYSCSFNGRACSLPHPNHSAVHSCAEHTDVLGGVQLWTVIFQLQLLVSWLVNMLITNFTVRANPNTAAEVGQADYASDTRQRVANDTRPPQCDDEKRSCQHCAAPPTDERLDHPNQLQV